MRYLHLCHKTERDQGQNRCQSLEFNDLLEKKDSSRLRVSGAHNERIKVHITYLIPGHKK